VVVVVVIAIFAVLIFAGLRADEPGFIGSIGSYL